MTETDQEPSQADLAVARAEAVKAADRQAFNNVMRGTGIHTNSDGQAVVVDREDEVQPEPVAAEPETSSEDDQSTTSALPDDFEQRLRWDNWTPKAIEVARSTLDEDELLEMYEAVQKRQSRIDRLYHERNKAAKVKPEPKAEEAKQESPSLRDVLGDKTEQLGDDVVEALDGYFNERLQRIESEAVRSQQQPAMDTTVVDTVNAEVEAYRARLADMLPSVRHDGPEWDWIVQQANQESENPYYRTRFADNPTGAVQAVFDNVIAREYGVSSPSAPVRGTTTRSGPVTRNSAATSSVRQSAPRELSKKERERVILEHVMRNPGDLDGARRKAGLEPLNLHPRDKQRPR